MDTPEMDTANPIPLPLVKVRRHEDWSILHERVIDAAPNWDRIREVAPRLEAAARRDNLLGLSALQVGIREPFFWMNVVHDGRKYQCFCVSPQIMGQYGPAVAHKECSASYPEQAFAVERHPVVRVRFHALDGYEREKVLSQLPGFVFQHLYDHLCGVLPMDRGAPTLITKRLEGV